MLDAPLQIWYILASSLRGGAVAARRAHNPKVAGSSPAPATLIKRPCYPWSFFVYEFILTCEIYKGFTDIKYFTKGPFTCDLVDGLC